MATKICTKCGQEKPLSEFYYHRVRKYYMHSCKECNKKHSTEYQQRGYRKTEKYVFYQRAYGIRRYCRIKGMGVMADLEKYLKRLWQSQNGICFYSGLRMYLTGYQTSDYAMTVDRLDPSKDYTKDNMVLCCAIVNRMKQNLQYVELLKMCGHLLNNRGEVLRKISEIGKEVQDNRIYPLLANKTKAE